jgi:hypothetical protein
MADILELEPDLLELEQFHHEVIRPEQPIFNPLGQYCVVKRCSSMIKFHKLRDLITHWQHVHQPKRQISKCKICRRVFDRRQRVLQHLKSVHKITGDTAPVYVVNNEFIPPGEAIQLRIGTPEENMVFIQKEKEWEHQVRKAKALASTASSLSARRELEELMERYN